MRPRRSRAGFSVAAKTTPDVPIVTLTRWRRVAHPQLPPDVARAAALSKTSYTQLALLVGMVVAATGMARGFGS